MKNGIFAIKTLFLVLFVIVVYASVAVGGCIKGNCNDGRGTFTYSGGSVYTGEWKNNKRDGHGSLTRPQGASYAGYWKNDKMDGMGTYTYPDGSTYLGQWKNNKRNGKGRYTSSSGSAYEGQWKDGKLFGEGVLITSGGNKFIGQFDKNGKLIGKYMPLLEGTPLRTSKALTEVKKEDKTTSKSSAEKAAKIQRELSGQRSLSGPLGMTFIYILPGSFIMGSPQGESGRYDNETQHQVFLTQGFYMQNTEVTQGQWGAVMKTNPSFFSNCGDACPVEQVSFEDIQQFISKLNELEGTETYRLPTEAEWEYACRSGNTEAFASGTITKLECSRDTNLDAIGWFCGNSNHTTHPFAQKKPNALGLFDMHGNVLELCQDWYGVYPSNRTTDPKGPTSGTDRTVRGGGWDTQARNCRSACRGALSPGERSYDVGFRLVRTP